VYLVRYVNLCLITENKFVLEKVAVGQIFLQVFQLSPVRVTEPALHNHSIYHLCYIISVIYSIIKQHT